MKYYVFIFNSICIILLFYIFGTWVPKPPKPRYSQVSGHIARGESGCPRMWRSEVVATATTEHNNNDVDQEKVKEWTQGDFVNVSVRRGCRLGQPVLTRLLSRVSNFVLVFQIIFHLCGNQLEEFDGKFNQICSNILRYF